MGCCTWWAMCRAAWVGLDRVVNMVDQDMIAWVDQDMADSSHKVVVDKVPCLVASSEQMVVCLVDRVEVPLARMVAAHCLLIGIVTLCLDWLGWLKACFELVVPCCVIAFFCVKFNRENLWAFEATSWKVD